MSNSRNPNQRNQEAEHMFYQPNPMDNRKAPQQQQQNPNYYASVNDNLEFHGIPGAGGGHRNNSFYNNSNRNEDQLGGTWIWRSGDRCMAKYWEDNMVGFFYVCQLNQNLSKYFSLFFLLLID